VAYYNNLLNMGEPVSVQPLPQPLLTSPFNYTDTGLLPISIPSYSAPTPQPYTPIEPGPFGVEPVAPVAPVRGSFDTNAPEMEDIEAELDLANEAGKNNAFSSLNPGRSLALSIASTFAPAPISTALGAINNYNAYQAQAFNQALANVAQNRSVFDTIAESLGLGYSDGIGGYGRGGRGGYAGAMDYTDPGVAGPARAEARSALNAAVGFSINPAPGTQGWSDAVDGLTDGVGPDEAPGGIDYSGEVGGYNDPGGFDFGDMSDFSGGADASDASDAGDTHICTAAFRAGISPRERFRENKKYGIKLRREDPVLMRGYDIVGPWIAKKIGHTKMGNALTRLYAAKAGGETLSAKQKILDATLNLTTRPALRLVGRFA
jgi:hypothetical protein